MGLQWKTISLKNNDTKEVTFSDNVQSYFAGISAYQLQYERYHHIQHAGVVLDTEKNSEKTITVKAQLTISDDSHNSGYESFTWVYVTVVAWCGNDSNSAFLTNQSSIPSSITPPLQPLYAGAVLSAFKMSFDDSDRTLMEITANVNAYTSTSKYEVDVTGSAEMNNDKHESNQDTLRAGVIMALVSNPGYQIRTVSVSPPKDGSGKSNTKVSAHFDGDVSDAIAILSSFDMAFKKDDYSIRSIRAGASRYNDDGNSWSFGKAAIFISGDKVTVTTNATLLKSESTQSEENNLTFLVIAIMK
jgi:hypothetical protein